MRNGSDVAPNQEGELIVRGPQCHARLSQQAGRNPQCAARRLVLHRRSRPAATRTAFSPSPDGSRNSSSAAARTSRRPRSRKSSIPIEAVLDCAVVGIAARASRRGSGAVHRAAARPDDRNRSRAGPLPGAALGLQSAASRARDRRNPSHRVGQDHTLQAARAAESLNALAAF